MFQDNLLRMDYLLRKIGVSCFLFCFVLSLQSQEEYLYHITDYTPENGLAGRFANFTHKDNRGLIWIGTQHGLHRFDGRIFKVFEETTGLPFNQVMEIYEDGEGWLWLYRSCLGKDRGLKGYIKYTGENQLYVEVEGKSGAVQSFLDWCRQGPSLARVDEYEAQESELKGV